MECEPTAEADLDSDQSREAVYEFVSTAEADARSVTESAAKSAGDYVAESRVDACLAAEINDAGHSSVIKS